MPSITTGGAGLLTLADTLALMAVQVQGQPLAGHGGACHGDEGESGGLGDSLSAVAIEERDEQPDRCWGAITVSPETESIGGFVPSPQIRRVRCYAAQPARGAPIRAFRTQ